MKNKSNYLKNVKKTPAVTLMPCWMLKMKGRMDAKKGKDVCDVAIFRMQRKVCVMESNEGLDVKEVLKEPRKEAILILHKLDTCKEEMKYLSMAPAGGDARIELENLRKAERSGTLNIEYISMLERLVVIHEEIVQVNAMYEERISKLRAQMDEKVQAYCMGVSHHLSNYEVLEYMGNQWKKNVDERKYLALEERISKVITEKVI